MPCHTYVPEEELEQERREAYMQEFRHNSPVAEMLCGVLSSMTSAQISALDKKTRKWWAEHKRRDAKKARLEGGAK